MKSRYWSFLFAALAVAGLAFAAKAATFTWTGNSTARDANGAKLWADAGNWECSDSNRTKYPYPKQNSDLAILPPFAEKQVIAFPDGSSSYNNFQYLKMTEAGADYEFVHSPDVEDGTVIMQFAYPDAIQISAGRMTFNGIGVYVNGKNLTTLTGGTLVLTNGANFGGTGKLGTTTISGANLFVTGGSVFNVGGTTGAISLNVSPDADGNGGVVTVDDGTVLAGILNLGQARAGGRMVLKGSHPRLYISSSGYAVSSYGGELAFEIPQGGFGDWVPIITKSDNSKNFTNGNIGPTVTVVAESPVFNSPYDGVVPLITCKIAAGNMKNCVSGKLSDCECASPASCAWRFSTATMTSNAAIADTGTISDYDWFEECKTGSKDPATTFIGVAVHGESSDPEPPVEPGQPQPPQFASFAADGSAGDAIAVTGEMGTGGTVTVEVSTTEDFATVYSSADKGAVATNGTFEATFHNATPTAADYIHPGETYCVRAIATSLEEGCDLAATSKVVTVTTVSGSTAVVTTFTHSSSNVTIVGTLDPKGAGTTEVHILWCEDGIAYDRDVKVATIGPDDDPAWEWSTTLDNEEILFCYKIYATNSCAGASWQTDPVLGKDTDLPYDTSAKYMWVADENGCFDGAWTDRAHWKPVKADGSDYHGLRADYPDQDSKNVKPFDFSAVEGTNAVITLPAATVRWGTVLTFPGANDSSITFKGSPGQTEIVRANPSGVFTFVNTDSSLVFDGLSVSFSANVMFAGEGSTLVVQNGAYFRTTGKINLGTESPSGTAYAKNIMLVVDDATVDLSGGDRNRSIWASVKLPNGQEKPATLIVRGKNPKLRLSCLADLGGGGKVVFNIPKGGYGDTPIVFESTSSEAQRLPYRQETAGQVKAMRFMIDRDSEALTQAKNRTRTYELVDWSKGIDPTYALLDGDGGEVKVSSARNYRFGYDDATSPKKISVAITGPNGLVITVTGVR